MTLDCSRQRFQQFWGENAPNLCDKLAGKKGCPNIQRLSKKGQELLDTPRKINSFGSCWVESGEKKEPRHPSGKTSEEGCKIWRRQRERDTRLSESYGIFSVRVSGMMYTSPPFRIEETKQNKAEQNSRRLPQTQKYLDLEK